MDATAYRDGLVALRRELHRRPEPAWCEYYTTARIVDELKQIGVDELHIGPDAIAADARQSVPDEETLTTWLGRARATDVDQAVLDQLTGGHTGVVAELAGDAPEQGPTVALRVDIDGLPREEATTADHTPVQEEFRSEHDGHMHACGHDAHAAIGVGVVKALSEASFPGRAKVIFQPAEEQIGGGPAIAQSGHLDDIDALLAVHVGLDHPTGEVVAGVDGFLAVTNLEATFRGEGAHAGGRPERGRNAVQAMATAVQNLYAIARHGDGATRINAGEVNGGSAGNVIPDTAHIVGEVRGETTALMNYTRDRAEQVLESAATMHECELSLEYGSEAPSAESDDQPREFVAAAADTNDRVETVLDSDALGGSEDASFLMQRVQDRGGVAAYVGVGTDHPGGHHTATFDVDETSILVGVEVLADALLAMARAEIDATAQSEHDGTPAGTPPEER
ncbi:MAG: amidohydrolase [halophilic archaeon J07HX5]|nr:MAG: amidohydrolase [halophilic archaeon J07HX5]